MEKDTEKKEVRLKDKTKDEKDTDKRPSEDIDDFIFEEEGYSCSER